jgi:heptosyltransferase I
VPFPLKVLILKPSSLGDVVQALPVLRLLKRHLPESECHWWIASAFAPLLEKDPDLAGLIVFQRQRWQSPWRWLELLKSVRRMRGEKFDLVIDLQGLARSGLVAWLANGAESIGLGNHREGARGLYDRAVDRPSGARHAVDWYLRVLEELRVPIHWDFDWLPRQPDMEASVRAKWPDINADCVVLCPGARWLNKRWPVEHFEAFVRLRVRRHRHSRFAVIGGAEDLDLGRRIQHAAPGQVLDLTGRTTLPELVEVIRACGGLITNDSGPMHVAAALRKPVLALFGPTAPEQTGPFGQPEQVLQNRGLACVPCLKSTCAYRLPLECLNSILPETVDARWEQRCTGAH